MKWKSQTHSANGKFSNSEKFPGITTLFLKLAEDDNLTGLQTITKKAFHMLISKRTTKHCGTICYSKISSLGKLFLFLVQMLKVLNLLCFVSTQIDHLNGLQTIVKLWTYDLAMRQSGNLAIWQSGSNLAAIWQQSGSNLTAIWQQSGNLGMSILISKRTTNYCGTICHSKISSLGELFLFLVQMLKSLNLLYFSAHRLTTWMDYKPLSSF